MLGVEIVVRTAAEDGEKAHLRNWRVHADHHRRLSVDNGAGLLWLILAGGLLFLIVLGGACYLWNPFRMKEPGMRQSRSSSLRDLSTVMNAYDEVK